MWPVLTSRPGPLLREERSLARWTQIAVEGVLHNPSLNAASGELEVTNDLAVSLTGADLRGLASGTTRWHGKMTGNDLVHGKDLGSLFVLSRERRFSLWLDLI